MAYEGSLVRAFPPWQPLHSGRRHNDFIDDLDLDDQVVIVLGTVGSSG
jgi:hypothetical protein